MNTDNWRRRITGENKPFDSFLSDDNLVFLENDCIRIGVNLSLGGALTYLAEKI